MNHKQWTYNTPQRGHSLTNALGYSDDTALACTSWPAGWFAQIHYLMAKFEWGIPVGFKPGKTDPVSKTALWIGYLFNCAAMSVALHEERLLKMRVKLRPFSSDPDVAQLARSGGPTAADARNLLGVLQFGTNIILIGKAYMGEIQKILNGLNAQARFGLAAPDTKFCGSKRSKHTADMWCALLETMSVRSAVIGVRRQVFPHTAQGDASLSKHIGWCWAQMGHIKYGSWPEVWLNKIGPHSELAEIFITELECLAILFCARFMFPRCVGMRWEGYSDNLGAVFMFNKLTARAERIAPIIREVLWLAAAYDVEIAYAHVPTYRNVLTDAGTRQEAKDFDVHLRQFREAYPPEWVREQERLFPLRESPRPELLAATPVVHRDVFESANLDLGEMAAVLPEWISAGLTSSNEQRAAAFVQENAAPSS
jgi:hypothetical protein